MNKSCSLIVFLIALIKWDYSFVPCTTMHVSWQQTTHTYTDITYIVYIEPRMYEAYTGWTICIWTIFESGCGIQVSQATPTKFSMLFKHNYGKLSWKFGDHSLNFSFVHGPSWLRILESIHRYGVIFTFCKKISKGHCEAMLDVKKIYFIDF